MENETNELKIEDNANEPPPLDST